MSMPIAQGDMHVVVCCNTDYSIGNCRLRDDCASRDMRTA